MHDNANGVAFLAEKLEAFSLENGQDKNCIGRNAGLNVSTF